MRAITWNLAHGRDFPPDPELRTWRSRLCRVTETNATHAQVNRSLLEEFATVLGRDGWDIALLQEAPPRWLSPLCRAVRAHGALALTSRNLGAAWRSCVAERNPDLIASNEGGSNQVLVRPPWRIREVRRLTLSLLPERRRMIWARLEGPGGESLAAATLHATARDELAAAADCELAAERSLAWGGGTPLVFGGDLNLRPSTAPGAFERLERRFALAPPTSATAIDHLFVRGLERGGAPAMLEPRWRELPFEGGRSLRLSDHDPIAVEFARPRAR